MVKNAAAVMYPDLPLSIAPLTVETRLLCPLAAVDVLLNHGRQLGDEVPCNKQMPQCCLLQHKATFCQGECSAHLSANTEAYHPKHSKHPLSFDNFFTTVNLLKVLHARQ